MADNVQQEYHKRWMAKVEMYGRKLLNNQTRCSLCQREVSTGRFIYHSRGCQGGNDAVKQLCTIAYESRVVMPKLPDPVLLFETIVAFHPGDLPIPAYAEKAADSAQRAAQCAAEAAAARQNALLAVTNLDLVAARAHARLARTAHENADFFAKDAEAASAHAVEDNRVADAAVVIDHAGNARASAQAAKNSANAARVSVHAARRAAAHNANFEPVYEDNLDINADEVNHQINLDINADEVNHQINLDINADEVNTQIFQDDQDHYEDGELGEWTDDDDDDHVTEPIANPQADRFTEDDQDHYEDGELGEWTDDDDDVTEPIANPQADRFNPVIEQNIPNQHMDVLVEEGDDDDGIESANSQLNEDDDIGVVNNLEDNIGEGESAEAAGATRQPRLQRNAAVRRRSLQGMQAPARQAKKRRTQPGNSESAQGTGQHQSSHTAVQSIGVQAPKDLDPKDLYHPDNLLRLLHNECEALRVMMINHFGAY